MFAEERLEKILEFIKESGKVKVTDLSSFFNVSKDLIRKDLNKLEESGQITRTYGGAILKRESAPNITINQRLTKNSELKSRIASKAYSLIKDKEKIFLDMSSINVLLANNIALGKKSMTVITNMLEIMLILSKANHIKVIGTGGILNKELSGFIGIETINYLKKYRVERSFIGTTGIDILNNYITTFEPEDGQTKKAILQCSKTKYLVMENEKFYQDGNYIFSKLDEIDGIITETLPPKELYDLLKENNIKIY